MAINDQYIGHTWNMGQRTQKWSKVKGLNLKEICVFCISHPYPWSKKLDH